MLGVLFSNNHKDIKNLGLTFCSPLHNLLNNKNLQFSTERFNPEEASLLKKLNIDNFHLMNNNTTYPMMLF